MELPAYQQRVMIEKTALDEKIGKLTQFLATPAADALPLRERYLLEKQRGIMVMYGTVLDERIEMFGVRA